MNSTIRTQIQTETALFWAQDNTLMSHWNQVNPDLTSASELLLFKILVCLQRYKFAHDTGKIKEMAQIADAFVSQTSAQGIEWKASLM